MRGTLSFHKKRKYAKIHQREPLSMGRLRAPPVADAASRGWCSGRNATSESERIAFRAPQTGRSALSISAKIKGDARWASPFILVEMLNNLNSRKGVSLFTRLCVQGRTVCTHWAQSQSSNLSVLATSSTAVRRSPFPSRGRLSLTFNRNPRHGCVGGFFYPIISFKYAALMAAHSIWVLPALAWSCSTITHWVPTSRAAASRADTS